MQRLMLLDKLLFMWYPFGADALIDQGERGSMFSFKRLATGQGVALLLIGAVGGLLVATLVAPRLGWNVREVEGLVWGLVVGSCLAHLPDFIEAGAKLTHKEHRGLNLAVGLLGAAVLIAALIGLVFLLGAILQSCGGSG
jgi:hypothetical protein